jgi:ribose/xylose/arabinose/galactoside ABC-type transport system permease subunit
MVFVLLALCAWFSWVTMADQHPTGAAAGEQLARQLRGRGPVLAVARDTPEDAQFVSALERSLERGQLVRAVQGQPADARRALEQHRAEIKVVACNQATANWSVFDGSIPVYKPHSYRWPNFLKRENLLNIANQIAVIAIVAIGMTMVIITRGIDLSVGSLIALAAVAATLLIRDRAGAENATAAAMAFSSFGAIALCGFIGFLSGVLVTYFAVPAFIATLGMMLVASGLAFIVAKGQSIYQVPDTFIWLGRGDAFGIPNAVWLMAILYLLAHVLMTHTALGRYIYAVGGNPEAARFSGVPVNRVILFVYTISGALAGLGGVIMASQLKSGSPTYGLMYELFVIAAAVVGGTSLSGGHGKILGMLIGALIIAVIQNGMNLTGVESYTQKVVLGLVILGAVLVDILKKRGWEKYLRRAKA